jgi:hypothetical protein
MIAPTQLAQLGQRGHPVARARRQAAGRAQGRPLRSTALARHLTKARKPGCRATQCDRATTPADGQDQPRSAETSRPRELWALPRAVRPILEPPDEQRELSLRPCARHHFGPSRCAIAERGRAPPDADACRDSTSARPTIESSSRNPTSSTAGADETQQDQRHLADPRCAGTKDAPTGSSRLAELCRDTHERMTLPRQSSPSRRTGTPSTALALSREGGRLD